MPTRLSDFFTLDEFVASQYASRHGIDNSPSLEIVAKLTRTGLEMDKVRRLLGRPVIVSSGYRCPTLNRAIGSDDDSQHVKGEAVDFICPGFGSPLDVFNKIRLSCIEFDQLIVECGRWVHISFSPRKRRQCLAFDGQHYFPVA